LTPARPLLPRYAGYFRRADTPRAPGPSKSDPITRRAKPAYVKGLTSWTTKLTNDPRVTPVGDFLPRASLDEPPQLYSVLKGNLAPVGPRPIAEEYDDLIEGRLDATAPGAPRATAHAGCSQGVTGYWQINGPLRTTHEEHMRLDTANATGWSLNLGLVILAKTAALFDRGSAY